MKESVNLKKIKLIEGDIGLTFLDAQVLLTKLGLDITKDKKDAGQAVTCLFNLMKLKETVGGRG